MRTPWASWADDVERNSILIHRDAGLASTFSASLQHTFANTSTSMRCVSVPPRRCEKTLARALQPRLPRWRQPDGHTRELRLRSFEETDGFRRDDVDHGHPVCPGNDLIDGAANSACSGSSLRPIAGSRIKSVRSTGDIGDFPARRGGGASSPCARAYRDFPSTALSANRARSMILSKQEFARHSHKVVSRIQGGRWSTSSRRKRLFLEASQLSSASMPVRLCQRGSLG